MSIRVERSVDDPIVTFTFDGILNLETVQEMQTQMGQLLAELGTFYAVIDFQGTGITEAVSLLGNSSMPALRADPRINYVFVGQPVQDNLTNQTGIPLFPNKEMAFEYIRREIATNVPGQLGE